MVSLWFFVLVNSSIIICAAQYVFPIWTKNGKTIGVLRFILRTVRPPFGTFILILCISQQWVPGGRKG